MDDFLVFGDSFDLCLQNLEQVLMWCKETNLGWNIIKQCHEGPIGGYYSTNHTACKVHDSGFFWPTLFQDTHQHV